MSSKRYKDWGFVEKPLVILQKALGAAEQAAEEGTEEAADTDAVENPATETGGEQQELLNA